MVTAKGGICCRKFFSGHRLNPLGRWAGWLLAAQLRPAWEVVLNQSRSADFNGDGKQDLAVASDSDTVSIRPGDGFGRL